MLILWSVFDILDCYSYTYKMLMIEICSENFYMIPLYLKIKDFESFVYLDDFKTFRPKKVPIVKLIRQGRVTNYRFI